MMRRPEIFGRGQALHGDLTTTGARLISTLTSNATANSRGMVRRDDPTTVCPKCGRPGVVAEGESKFNLLGKPIALDGHCVSCGCPTGSNRIIAPLGQLSSSTSSTHVSASNTAFSLNKIQERGSEKRVTGIYWTYGDDLTPVEGISRHYSDLNLHVKTENYLSGEFVEVEIYFENGNTELHKIKVDESNTGTTRKIFSHTLIKLDYEA